MADSDGNEAEIATWLDRHLLEALEAAIFGDKAPTFDELQGMYFDEYQRRSTGPLLYLYERDKEEFKINFGNHVEQRREERPHEHIQRLVHHIVRARKKIPCLVFDNADHFNIEFQERVFQYARSIYEKELCLVIMPITDRTSWQLSREGALRSFENESLFLPTPPPQVVLKKRIDFLEQKLADEKREPGRGYFIGRGIHLSIDDLTAFTGTLQTIFLRTGNTANWIGDLSNRDIRRCLDLAKAVVTSPHLEIQELLNAYIANSNLHVPSYKIKRALLKGKYDTYPVGIHTFVRNIYSLDDELETSPLLGIRLLQLLKDAQESDPKNPFITLDQTIQYFQAMMVDSGVTLGWLSEMLEAGLCLSYDPTVTTISNAGRIELSPAGLQHLRWGISDIDYVQIMLEVTPLVDREVFGRLTNFGKQPLRDVWRDELECFLDYLIAEDNKFCKVPDKHEAYTVQRQIASKLKRHVLRSA